MTFARHISAAEFEEIAMTDAKQSAKPGTRMHPGPWSWEAHQLSEGESCIVYDGAGQRVGTDHLDRETAAKITAAPTMLAALEAIESALRKDSRQKTINGDDTEYHLDGQTMWHAINGAREAIKQARGGGE